jgi:hypothetical protein
VARHVPQERFEETLEELMEGIDTRATKEFKELNALRTRDLDSISSWTRLRIGDGAAKADSDFRNRWPKRSRESTAQLSTLATKFCSVKTATLSTYSSNRVGFQQFCKSCDPELEPWPLRAKAIVMWLLARYEKGLKSNASNTKPLVSSLTHHAVNELGQALDVPHPGMAIKERLVLRRAIAALDELEDLCVRRSIPLTTRLLRLIIEERVVTPVEEPTTVEELEVLRDVARYGLNRVCMLRKNDIEGDKQRRGSYVAVPDANSSHAGKLLVPPGKSHSDDPWAQVPGLVRGRAADFKRWLSPGFAMAKWLEAYDRLMGGECDPQRPLFPEFNGAGKPTLAVASSANFQATLRRWCSEVGLPGEFSDRVTLHGFRSGGCTDAINSGKMTIYQIKAQGRWSSQAVEMYIHHSSKLVRDTLAEVIDEAGLSTGEKSASAARSLAMLRKWHSAYEAERAAAAV